MANSHPRWQQYVLWILPIITWAALTFVLWPSAEPLPVNPLLKSSDKETLNKVEAFLQQEGIAYIRKAKDKIYVNSDKHRQVLRQLREHHLLGYVSSATERPAVE